MQRPCVTAQNNNGPIAFHASVRSKSNHRHQSQSKVENQANVTPLECLPYSVGYEDEGVCLLLRIGPYRVLLDCGLKNIAPLSEAISDNGLPADLVFCSHAHPDHAQGLLALHQAFNQLPIYASEVTTQLLPLNWPDLCMSNPPGVTPFFQALPWRTPIELLDGLTAQLFPSGHLPGAAAILLSYLDPQESKRSSHTYTVLYTGDFLLSNSRLVEGLPLEELRGLRPDVLILEGTYGTSRIRKRRTLENQLAERINRAIAQGQSVILPSPALGLGQELLMLLRSHHHFTGKDLDIWVDGQVALGCDAYLNILSDLPTTVQNFAQHQPLFWDDRVRPRTRRLLPEQRQLLGGSPCIVLTDETADLQQYCQTASTPWLVLTPESPGQPRIRPSVPPENPQLFVETYLLAEHCDVSGTTQLIHNIRPQHVLFFHSSANYLADLTNLEELRNRYQLHLPQGMQLVELPIGETFIQPENTPTTYEGELTEEDDWVTIGLPGAISTDPRWQTFADTGLVEIRWQGDELVLRGLSQRELLNQGNAARVPPEIDCCGNCWHYRGQRCWNQNSPLFSFKVTPTGYCPAFEATGTQS
ncbi:MBL fold metallo-hydrolase [Planktothricoides sp. FACHB-1370]|uniref:MBL fold metallo-hydrolase n=1 Tax=Planktothricoides raciborskii FACHB-1370 TaxID=2949576 RepID=A0ABR8EEU6_9CYAN|nr:MBL fold metallo-hydrolase [Planktothricoides raciborskii FACHB-1370]MBD2580776.1 MBL fold metallo-hydrolase [Planktothricoides raciborskii FACHB-1261]